MDNVISKWILSQTPLNLVSFVKGNIARTYFHMMKEHGAQIPNTQKTMMLYWDKLDPVDEWECKRNARIKDVQGLGNSFVTEACKAL